MRNFVVFGLGVVVTVAVWACKVRVAESNLQADGIGFAGTCLVKVAPNSGHITDLKKFIQCSDSAAVDRFVNASNYSTGGDNTENLIANFVKLNQAGFQFVGDFPAYDVKYVVFRY